MQIVGASKKSTTKENERETQKKPLKTNEKSLSDIHLSICHNAFKIYYE